MPKQPFYMPLAEFISITNDHSILQTVSNLLVIKKAKDGLEKNEKELKGRLEPLFKETGVDGILYEGYKISRIKSETTSISYDLLMELGVDPAIINKATKTTPKEYVEIRATGKQG